MKSFCFSVVRLDIDRIYELVFRWNMEIHDKLEQAWLYTINCDKFINSEVDLY